MKIPFLQRETRAEPDRETRASTYGDAVIAQLLEGAGGDADIPAHSTAAEEVAAGLWARAFASAHVEPDTPATRALTPDVLAQIGRQLLFPGESLWEIRVESGRVVLDNANAYDIAGSREWLYRLTFAYPSGMITRTLPADRVVHVRYSTNAIEPWKGVGPFQKASTTLRVGSRLETRLGDESGARAGYLVPVPQVDPELQGDLNKLKGKTVLVQSTASGWNQGEAPKGDFEPRRLGFSPPATIEPLRDGVSRSILAAAGVPPAMLGGNVNGTLLRESYRQFLHSTISPVARIMTGEFRLKLDTPELTLSFNDLMAGDIAGRARAFQSLVGGGMEIERAATLSGLLTE